APRHNALGLRSAAEWGVPISSLYAWPGWPLPRRSNFRAPTPGRRYPWRYWGPKSGRGHQPSFVGSQWLAVVVPRASAATEPRANRKRAGASTLRRPREPGTASAEKGAILARRHRCGRETAHPASEPKCKDKKASRQLLGG